MSLDRPQIVQEVAEEEDSEYRSPYRTNRHRSIVPTA